MSDANRTLVSYAREISYKTTIPALPAQDQNGNVNLFNLRFTKESLEAEKETVMSDEVRADRMVSAIVQVGQKGSGGIDMELIAGDYDDLFNAALMADNLTNVTATCAISASGQTITAATGTPFAALAASNPKFILIAGATNPLNNGYKTVSAITATVITLGDSNMASDDASPSLTISVNYTTAIDGVTVTVSGQVMTATSGTFSAATQGARYVKILLAATAGNNGIKKVVSCTGTVLTLAAGSLTGSDAGDVLTVQCNYARTGTTYQTHVIEKAFLDIPHYIAFTGMGVDSVEMKLEARKISTLSFTFMGYKGLESSRSINGADFNIAASTNFPMNAASNIGSVTKDGTAMLNPIKSLSLKIANNLRERPIISDLGSAAHGQGRSEITGELQVYFANKELLREFLSHTAMAVEFPVIDIAGNTMNFYMPAVQSTKGTPIGTGVNTDVMQTIPIQAFESSSLKYQLQIDRLMA